MLTITTATATTTLLLLSSAVPLVTGTGTIVCTNKIADFNVIDTSVSPPIFTDLTPTVDLSDFSTCRLNIEATTASAPANCDERTTKCVKFFLDGVEVRKEKFAPYTFFGDVIGGAINSGKPPIGKHTLKACTYSDKACTKNEMGCKEMEVDFLDCGRPTEAPVLAPVAAPVLAPVATPVKAPVATPVKAPVATPVSEPVCDSINEVTGFELVDAESPYRPVITSFSPPMIDLLDFPTCSLNIFAKTSENGCNDAPIKCVKLSLGGQRRKEQFSPYALYGNTGRFIRSGKPSLGAQTLKACTYTNAQCTEGESGCLEVDVFVKDCLSMSM